MAAKASEQREIYYSGRVQGVGFRYTVRSLARRFAVAGFVKNLPDGRVELVAEGPSDEVQRFLAAVQSEMGDYIDQVQESSRPAAGRCSGFEIRF